MGFTGESGSEVEVWSVILGVERSTPELPEVHEIPVLKQ